MKGLLEMFRRRRNKPDLEAFFADIAQHEPYSKFDRYRDFRQLFLGSPQGKRVLYEILKWCHHWNSSATIANFNTEKTLFHEGERNVGLMLIAATYREPKVRPTSSKENK